MLKDRTFKVVWVNRKNGTGIGLAGNAEIVEYSGHEIKIKK